MNLPFGIPIVKETIVRRRDDSSEAAAHYERKLAEYRDTLENYKRCILDYSGKLDGYDRRSMDNQLTIIQTALDMTYLKEQGDKIIELLHDMKVETLDNTVANLDVIASGTTDVNSKLGSLDKGMEAMVKSIGLLDKNVDGLDQNVVNRLSELLLELQKQTMTHNRQMQSELSADMEKLDKSVKKGQALLWFILIFNLFGLSAIAAVVLYYLEIIPFSF